MMKYDIIAPNGPLNTRTDARTITHIHKINTPNSKHTKKRAHTRAARELDTRFGHSTFCLVRSSGGCEKLPVAVFIIIPRTAYGYFAVVLYFFLFYCTHTIYVYNNNMYVRKTGVIVVRAVPACARWSLPVGFAERRD